MHSLSSLHRSSLVSVIVAGAGVAALGACHRDTGTTALTSASSATPPGSTNASAIPDADIAAAATRHLKEDDAVRSAPITVAVTNGICTLAGSVESVLAKERALRVVETLRGIRSVIDRVQVLPQSRTDEQIKQGVLAELQRESATRAHPVAVTVSGGSVTLAGTAPSRSEMRFYADLAKAVPGVRAIQNQITVTYATVPSEEAIATATKHRIADDIWLDGSTIGVTASGRTVHLKGVLGSVADKSRARDDAWLAGAEMVEDDGLTVDWAARDGQRASTNDPYRSDFQIASAVRDTFKLDPRLKLLEPNVTVQQGDVELTGTVDSMKAKRAAVLDTKNTVGVSNVRDHLVVQPSGVASDADINQSVVRALSRDYFVPDAKNIQPSTSKGKVVLEGKLASPFERFDAVEDAASVPGVYEIDDKLSVTRSPQEIKADIEDRLSWDATVEPGRVTILVAPDATVTLNGTLTSWSEIRAAVDDATRGGASQIVNLLKHQSRPDH